MTINVLLVEDDEVDAAHIARCSRDLDVTVHHVSNADSAWAFLGELEELSRWIALIDLSLPGLDGLDLVRKLRADARLARVPVVVLTTSAADTDVAAAADLGVAGYFVKAIEDATSSATFQAIIDYWSRSCLP